MASVLYIEDNQDTATAVQFLLQKEGFQTELAFTGNLGYNKAVKNEYDIILMDVMLPDMSGWDIFQKLKKANLNSKYVFLSVIPISTERLLELKASGVSDYITKPFKKEEILRRIKAILT